MRDIRVLAEPFSPGALVGPFSKAHPDQGAIVNFIGQVRPDAGVEALELTHYAPLTLPGMEQLTDAAFARFDLLGLQMIHRVGVMYPGDPIVCVSAASRHRRDALGAVDFAMDHLKSDAWFWKRERRGGVWHWIEPRDQDHSDLARWQ